jgi:hypothetical protein
MIEGLKIDVTSGELDGHLRERSAYHGDKARGYGSQVENLRGLQAGDTSQNYSNEPTHNLAQSADAHRKRAAFFLFLADHLVPNETYRLTERDLEQLELYSRYG